VPAAPSGFEARGLSLQPTATTEAAQSGNKRTDLKKADRMGVGS
jgi:hypothetical protein